VVVLALSLFASPLAAAAQQAGKAPRIGMIVPGSSSSFAARIASFRQGLRDLGYVEGRDVIVEYRFADGESERFQALAGELVRLAVRPRVEASRLSVGQSSATAHPRIENQACVDLR
jgi:hypothetical protein